MKIPLINSDDKKLAEVELKAFYDLGLIPAEKKPYLASLRESVGPYMGILGADKKTHYLLDAASQIATMGLGFNSTPLFGPAQFLESWTNIKHTESIREIRSAYESFLKRKLNWRSLHTTFTHSGAEANETALGYAFKTRRNKAAKKVMAFEGSFHGRMMVGLFSTWNKSKREPFEWPGFETTYMPFPELVDDQIKQPMPEIWKEIWEQAPSHKFEIPDWELDDTLKLEIDILNKIRIELLKGETFAVIIEPMQCEGGDRYSSDRFNNALLLMCRSFDVSLVFDEVQTGFHLGRNFFWHQDFNMTDIHNKPIAPDFVTCAKKAQTGIVISHKRYWRKDFIEEYSVASMIRGYVHAVTLDQQQSNIIALENKTRIYLQKLVDKYPKFLSRPRVYGMAFAVEVTEANIANKFVEERFNHALLYYPAGDKTLRFRLNTSFDENDLDYLFERLDALTNEIYNDIKADRKTHHFTKLRRPEFTYIWHELLIDQKIKAINGQKSSFKDLFKQVSKIVKDQNGVDLVEITTSNFEQYKDKIIELQNRSYEPARRTEIHKFEAVVNSDFFVALAAIKGDELQAITFAASMKETPLERGIRRDPSFHDPKHLYALDTTVNPQNQGDSLGKNMRYALATIALAKDLEAIKGRNRDRLAGQMLAINLSLGAYEKFYIHDDYPDFEEYRDVFFYKSNLKWERPSINLSNGIHAPQGLKSITSEFTKKNLSIMNNKICLSNFVSKEFLDNLKGNFDLLPAELRHGFSSSGQSECVDKVAKSIWVKNKEKGIAANTMITFDEHYFGEGSFLARTLSNSDEEAFFKVQRLPAIHQNPEAALTELSKVLDQKIHLGVWVEPMLQKKMSKISIDTLKKIREICTQKGVALIFNETGAGAYRFDDDSYFASGVASIMPDAGMCYLGSQAGFVFIKKELYLDKALMLISTWDGDELSFSQYANSRVNLVSKKSEYLQTRKMFQDRLIKLLKLFPIQELKIENGHGYFRGTIPNEIKNLFESRSDATGEYYLVCPSFDSMNDFLTRKFYANRL